MAETGSANAAAPVAGGFVTAPRPVTKTSIISPGCAGLAPGKLPLGPATTPSVEAISAAAWAEGFKTKTPGLTFAKGTTTAGLVLLRR